MNAERPEAPSQRLTPWFGVTGLLLLATLLAAAFVQVRQYALLSTAVQFQDDYLVLSLYQLETEYLRLRERWRQDLEPAGSTPPQLQLRYDIFVSRVGLMESERAVRLMSNSHEFDDTVRQLRDFVRRADLYLGERPRATLTHSSLASLALEIDALNQPIHMLALEASHHVAEQVAQRHDTVRRHNQVGIALTALLSVMTLIFASSRCGRCASSTNGIAASSS